MQQSSFSGEKLRLARLLNSWSLDELGGRVAASRQFVHQLENGAKEPSLEMVSALAVVLGVTETFFFKPLTAFVREDDCHFRKLATAPRAVMAQAAARGTLVEAVAGAVEKYLRLPAVHFPLIERPHDLGEIETIAEQARKFWGLGTDGPITNMTRVLERAGAVVVHFDDISDRVDALSISRRRPIVVRSSAKASAVRLRFDLAHECGHLIMHQGAATGDHETEDQANRFASAFLLPRQSFVREFPRSRSLDWNGMFRLKLRWKVAARAILRRAFDLGLIDAAQYRTGNIHLVKTGQAKCERYDDTMEAEASELLSTALAALAKRKPGLLRILVKDDLGLSVEMFEKCFGLRVPDCEPLPENVIRFPSAMRN